MREYLKQRNHLKHIPKAELIIKLFVRVNVFPHKTKKLMNSLYIRFMAISLKFISEHDIYFTHSY